MIPHAPAPHPHALVVVDDRRVLVASHGWVAGCFRVEKLEGVEVEREEFADVESQSSLHHEAAVHEHDVIGRHHRGGARARQRVRLTVPMRTLHHRGKVEGSLVGDAALLGGGGRRANLSPDRVVETERVHRVEARVRLVASAEHHHGTLFRVTELDGIGRDHGDVFVAATGSDGSDGVTGANARPAAELARAAIVVGARPPRRVAVEDGEVVRVREIVASIPDSVPAVEIRRAAVGGDGDARGGERLRAGVGLVCELAEE